MLALINILKKQNVVPIHTYTYEWNFLTCK